jgi:hypothetical protein
MAVFLSLNSDLAQKLSGKFLIFPGTFYTGLQQIKGFERI